MVTVLKKGTSKTRIEKILDKIRHNKPAKGIDAYKYCGIIKFPEDPLEFQKRMRDEWE